MERLGKAILLSGVAISVVASIKGVVEMFLILFTSYNMVAWLGYSVGFLLLGSAMTYIGAYLEAKAIVRPAEG